MVAKAEARDLNGRFREIVSDPLNLLINKDPRAGLIEDGYVFLHNGLRVPISGEFAYYGNFSSILAINRGVHEPLGEFVFQELIKCLPASPMMLELGSYWGHYSMWLKLFRPEATVHLVDSKLKRLDAGKHNFEENGFTGEFIHATVQKNQFEVDKYLAEKKIETVDILHSDIQGCEKEMLEDCTESLARKRINYLFVTTHSQQLHHSVEKILEDFDYRIEVSSDYDFCTTSFDGFIFASNPLREPVFEGFDPMSRIQIEEARPEQFLHYLSDIMQTIKTSR